MVGRVRIPSSPAPVARRGAARRARARRLTGAGVLAAVAVALACPTEAEAAPTPRDDRPFGKGTWLPTFGLGAGGFFSDIANVSVGLGFNYFLVHGLSAGLSFSDTILIYRSALKAQYPGIEDSLPTNIFDITPSLRYVFLRSRRFSPYVFAGAGPVFFNHGAGTHGQWAAGPGVFFNVGGPLFVNVSVTFSSMFPVDRCNDAVTYESDEGAIQLGVCSFQWGPQLGAVLAFGGGRAERRRRREQQERPEPYYPPPTPTTNPMGEAVDDEPAPAVAPAVDESGSAPTDVAAPPSDGVDPEPGAPTDVAPPPSTDAPTDVAAPPPADVPPTETPPADGAPTDVAAPGGVDTPTSEGAPTDVAPSPAEGPGGTP